jgi:hypothetical protein
MTNSNDSLLELADAEAQGERTVASLWPGDQFYFRGHFWTANTLQWHTDRQSIFVRASRLDDDEGTVNKTFLFGGLLVFPALLTDEHFRAENPHLQEGW